MGWFTELFYKKKALSDLKAWAAEQEKEYAQKHQETVKLLEQEFQGLLETAKEAVNALSNAELRNPDIPERAKHYMQGNREQIVKATTRLIENLLVPKTQGDLTFIDQQFQQYAQTNARAAAILSEFFGQEVKAITTALAEIEKRMNDVKASEQQKQSITEIQSRISAIENTARQNTELEQKQKELNEQINVLNQKLEDMKKQKEQLLASKDYAQVKEDLVSANRKRQQAEQAITDLFLPLVTAIKKYAHAVHDKNLEAYAENPLEALTKDYGLHIISHVPKIKEMLEKGELELKQDKRDKAKENITLLTKTHLAGLVHAYANAKKSEIETQKSITGRPILQELERINAELKQAEKDLNALSDEAGRLAPVSETGERNALQLLLKQYKITLT